MDLIFIKIKNEDIEMSLVTGNNLSTKTIIFHYYLEEKTMEWQFRLIQIYLITCDYWKQGLFYYSERRTNNHAKQDLTSVFPAYIEMLLKAKFPGHMLSKIKLIDSMPIVLASAKRSSNAKVANELANKGYCGSKDEY